MTREETRVLLELLLSNYTFARKDITNPKLTLDLWEMAFTDYEAERVYKAARFHMATNKYMPNPADLIKSMVRAEIAYDEPKRTFPQIEVPAVSYIEDMTQFDDLLDLEPDTIHCENCGQYNKCYGGKR